jgi:hypothetical protein
MTTIGGVVFRYLDRLPEVGDQVVMDGLIATVLDMEGHRLARVRVAKSSLGEEEPEAGTLEEKEESPGETMATQADGAKDGTEAYGPTSMGQAGQEETAHAETASTTPEEAGRLAEVVVLPPRKIDGPQEGPSHRAGRDISSGHRDVERD